MDSIRLRAVKSMNDVCVIDTVYNFIAYKDFIIGNYAISLNFNCHSESIVICKLDVRRSIPQCKIYLRAAPLTKCQSSIILLTTYNINSFTDCKNFVENFLNLLIKNKARFYGTRRHITGFSIDRRLNGDHAIYFDS